MPKDREEIVEFIDSMGNRAKNTFKTLKFAREYLRQVDGQIELEMEQ